MYHFLVLFGLNTLLLKIIQIMHTIALKKFLKNPGAFITNVDVEPVLLVQEEAENLMLIREADWRTLQETLYLLNSPVNAERLKSSIAEVLNNTASDTAG